MNTERVRTRAGSSIPRAEESAGAARVPPVLGRQRRARARGGAKIVAASLAAAFASLLFIAPRAGAGGPIIYNLSADWSDVQNPFGPWTLKKSPTAVFAINQSDFSMNGTGQHVWADEPYPLPTHAPYAARIGLTTGSPDYLPGDIQVHGAELDRTGTDFMSIVWTAPVSGNALIVGELWTAVSFGRTMKWEIRKNGSPVSGAVIVSNGSFPRTAPMGLEDGSGGAAATVHSVVAGDALELAFITLSDGGNLGEAVGIHMEIALTPTCCAGNADKVSPGSVTFNDILASLANFGSSGGYGAGVGDSDCDGDTDFNDILASLATFGSPCP